MGGKRLRPGQHVCFHQSRLICIFTGMQTTEEKLAALRRLMIDSDIDLYVIPSADPHLSEHIPDYWKIIPWLTGFTGSAGTVFVTDKFAGLWTDSRYFIQAENQLKDSGFILMNSFLPGKNDFTEWISVNMVYGNKLALDGRIFSVELTRMLEDSLADKNLIFDFNRDLISGLWIDRPSIPFSQAFDHSVLFSGKERSVKIAEVRALMKMCGAEYQLLTSPDDIMWLLNIRGNDLKYCPLLISYALVGEEQILLFIEESKIPLKLASEFDRLGIVMLPYEETAGMLSTLPAGSTVLLNPLTTSAILYNSFPPGMKMIEDLTIPTRLKAVKNRIEIENIGRAMIKDGVALSKFFIWLEKSNGKINLSELTLHEKLNYFRSEGEHYLGPSFSAIVAYDENGALPHYSATIESDTALGKEGILLIDSGGQYLDGTTDITRSISMGNPSEKQKRDFTLVLKGTINLALAIFPSGTKGCQLDLLARKALWENGLNYGHGTGHGVGFCLNVHEGPQSISPSAGTESKTVIEPGMLISDEPALYRKGEYGIRIENLILCVEDAETEFGKFLKFETVSLCYIDKSLIDISLLDKREIDWLNSYHTEVYEKLSPYLNLSEKKWLKRKTSSIRPTSPQKVS
jgi:Xaa-Pro aminopeptidase